MILRRAWAPSWQGLRQAAPGFALAVALATVARILAQALAHGAGGLPKFPLSPVMCAVLLGMLWRNTVGVPSWATRGLQWTMHRLLRVGIALVGLREPSPSHAAWGCCWRSARRFAAVPR